MVKEISEMKEDIMDLKLVDKELAYYIDMLENK